MKVPLWFIFSTILWISSTSHHLISNKKEERYKAYRFLRQDSTLTDSLKL